MRPVDLRPRHPRPWLTRPLVTVPAAAAVLAAGIASAPLAGATPSAQRASASLAAAGSSGEPSVDVRANTAGARPSVLAQRAAAKLTRAGATVRWDSTFGTPHTVIRRGSTLTGPTAGSASDVAHRWVAKNRALFGLSADDVAALVTSRDMELAGTGGRVVTFTQTFGGLPAAYGGRINVAVTRDGRVLSVTADARPSAAAPTSSRLSEAAAVAAVARVETLGARFTAKATGSQGGWATYDKGGFFGPHYARKVAFPTATGVRTAYRVIFHRAINAVDDVAIDAVTGKVLYRASLINTETDGSGLVFPNYPGAPRGGNQVRTPFGGNNIVSPLGWLDSAGTGPTTRGNNANTYANWDEVYPAANDTGPRPHETDGTFLYRFQDAWHDTSCGGTSYRRDKNAAVTNLFYQHNRIHDEYYRLGFTEAAGNFQTRNLGRGGVGGDAVQGLAQDGIQIGYLDNAFMATPPDGIPPFSGMFLWAPIPGGFLAPCVDGDFDMGVIQHEYTHGLSTRLVGGGNALNRYQSGAMGEGWSDWYALNHAFKASLETKPIVGAYVTGNHVRGIRNWNYDANPLNYSDLGYDLVGPEVHSDGELWTATLWDLRKALIAAYGEKSGVAIAEHVITDGMPLTAPNPSMLDARDGILAADVNRYGGAHLQVLWRVFAHRGMGVNAYSQHTGANAMANFQSASRTDNGDVRLRIVDEAGHQVAGVRVLVGDFEARVRPMAYSRRDESVSLRMVKGTYDITLQGSGWGSRTISGVTVRAGATTATTVVLAKNLASAANGARIVPSDTEASLPERNLIDDTEATAWAGPAHKALAVRSGRVTVKLAGPSTFREIQLSAYKEADSTYSRFAAMKDWTLQASTDGTHFRDVSTGSFPTTDPRPVAPLLHYQSVVLGAPVTASYVRLVVRNTQGVAQYVTAAELQLFDRRQ